MSAIPARTAVALFCCCREIGVVEMERRHWWYGGVGRMASRRKATSSDIACVWVRETGGVDNYSVMCWRYRSLHRCGDVFGNAKPYQEDGLPSSSE